MRDNFHGLVSTSIECKLKVERRELLRRPNFEFRFDKDTVSSQKRLIVCVHFLHIAVRKRLKYTKYG